MKKTENRNTITRIIVIVAILLILIQVTTNTAIAVTTNFPVGSQCYANVSDYLNLHKQPQDHEYIGQIKSGWTVTILEGPTRDDYYYVRIDKTGQTGWAYGGEGFLKPVEKKKTNTSTTKTTKQKASEECTDLGTGMLMAVISEKQLNVRKGPAKDKFRIEYLQYGDVVEILDGTVINNYVKVRTQSGKVGYVDITYLEYGVKIQSEEMCMFCECGFGCCK